MIYYYIVGENWSTDQRSSAEKYNGGFICLHTNNLESSFLHIDLPLYDRTSDFITFRICSPPVIKEIRKSIKVWGIMHTMFSI